LGGRDPLVGTVGLAGGATGGGAALLAGAEPGDRKVRFAGNGLTGVGRGAIVCVG
jgi:hypothetical protein